MPGAQRREPQVRDNRGMAGYVRPGIAPQVFRDDSGVVIDYGERWSVGSAPEDSYSVVAHPERFAPLHTVAEALIEHLADGYDVTVTDDPGVAGDLLHTRPRDDVVRAVRLTPSDPGAASLTIVLTAHPGVVVRAGVLHETLFPVCGCDACDEGWQELADDLEELVLAVADGRFCEEIAGRAPVRVSYEIFAADGSVRSGTSRNMPAERLGYARKALAALPGTGWRPWPRPKSGDREDQSRTSSE